MATTKIWPVHDSLKRLVDYAGNPEKTEYSDLRNTLHYAGNKEKTENFYFVSGINCDADKAYEQMVHVKKHFGKMHGNVAYHGYQSFRPGEVTPQQCHEIGLKLARQLWGERYQVLVATHLDKDHLHNHLLINSVSYVDGKKFNDNKKAYYDMRDASDRLCREYGLSVIEKPRGQTPRSIYFAEKNGEPTKYNLMRDALDKAMNSARTPEQFEKVLRSLGYEFNYNPSRKYATIKLIGSKKAVRLYRLGEKYDIPEINRRLDMNYRYGIGSPFRNYCSRLAKSHSAPAIRIRVRQRATRRIGGLKGLYYHYCYLLGYLPRGTKRKPLSPEMREAWRRLDRTSQQIRLISKYGFKNLDDVTSFISRTYSVMESIKADRNRIYNRLRRCNDPETESQLKSQRDECTAKLAALRKELKTAEHILEDNPKIREEISKEQQMKPLQQEIIKSEIKKRERERCR